MQRGASSILRCPLMITLAVMVEANQQGDHALLTRGRSLASFIESSSTRHYKKSLLFLHRWQQQCRWWSKRMEKEKMKQRHKHHRHYRHCHRILASGRTKQKAERNLAKGQLQPLTQTGDHNYTTHTSEATMTVPKRWALTQLRSTPAWKSSTGNIVGRINDGRIVAAPSYSNGSSSSIKKKEEVLVVVKGDRRLSPSLYRPIHVDDWPGCSLGLFVTNTHTNMHIDRHPS